MKFLVILALIALLVAYVMWRRARNRAYRAGIDAAATSSFAVFLTTLLRRVTSAIRPARRRSASRAKTGPANPARPATSRRSGRRAGLTDESSQPPTGSADE
jgi:hypothetical protein